MAQNHEYMQGVFFEYWERSLTMAMPEVAEDMDEEAAKKAEEEALKKAEGTVTDLARHQCPCLATAWKHLSIPRSRLAENASMLSRVAALVFALDKASADQEALQDAGETFNNLLEKV